MIVPYFKLKNLFIDAMITCLNGGNNGLDNVYLKDNECILFHKQGKYLYKLVCKALKTDKSTNSNLGLFVTTELFVKNIKKKTKFESVLFIECYYDWYLSEPMSTRHMHITTIYKLTNHWKTCQSFIASHIPESVWYKPSTWLQRYLLNKLRLLMENSIKGLNFRLAFMDDHQAFEKHFYKTIYRPKPTFIKKPVKKTNKKKPTKPSQLTFSNKTKPTTKTNKPKTKKQTNKKPTTKPTKTNKPKTKKTKSSK